MNKSQLSLVSGLLFLILDKITLGGLSWLYALLAIVALTYFVGIEALIIYRNIESKNKPPFGVNAQVFFDTLAERNSFTDKLSGLIQEVRREADPTNGLSTEQMKDINDSEEQLKRSGFEKTYDSKDAAPARPTSIRSGQLWRENDPRTKGRTVEVLNVVTDADGTKRANLVNTDTGRRTTSKVETLLKTGSRGYSYVGIK